MNLTALLTEVYGRLGVPSGDALFTSAWVTQSINAALHEIESEEDWPWYEASETLTTAAGTQSYNLASDWLRTREVKPANDYPLERNGIHQLEEWWPFGDSGQPSCYAIEQGKIYLFPIPNGVYSLTHRYVKTEPDLASGSDTPLMPAQFHAAIAELATYVALKRSRDDARGASALAAYQRWLSKMRKYRRRHKGPARIRTRWD